MPIGGTRKMNSQPASFLSVPQSAGFRSHASLHKALDSRTKNPRRSSLTAYPHPRLRGRSTGQTGLRPARTVIGHERDRGQNCTRCRSRCRGHLQNRQVWADLLAEDRGVLDICHALAPASWIRFQYSLFKARRELKEPDTIRNCKFFYSDPSG